MFELISSLFETFVTAVEGAFGAIVKAIRGTEA